MAIEEMTPEEVNFQILLRKINEATYDGTVAMIVLLTDLMYAASVETIIFQRRDLLGKIKEIAEIMKGTQKQVVDLKVELAEKIKKLRKSADLN